MDYEQLEQAARTISYRDKLRLAQLLIQLARREEEQAHPAGRLARAQGSGDADHLGQIRRRFPKAYERWTREEDDELRRLHEAGCGERELADRFGRQPSAIRSRIAKLLDAKR